MPDTPPPVPPGEAPPFQTGIGNQWVRVTPDGGLSYYYGVTGTWVPFKTPLAQTPPGLVPGSGPYRPFPGGPVYRVTPGGVLEVYTYGGPGWGAAPVGPATTTPATTPPRNPSGPNASPGAIGVLAAQATYDSLNGLWGAMQRVTAVNTEIVRLQNAGIQLDIQNARALDWASWLKNDSNGQALQSTLNCIANNIETIQDEIDRIMALQPQTWESYYQLSALQMSLYHMNMEVTYVQGLQHNVIFNGGPLPTFEQVLSVTCAPIPLEQAPMPTPVATLPPGVVPPFSSVEPGPLFPTPDTLPSQAGPIFPGMAEPPTKPLFEDVEATENFVRGEDMNARGNRGR